MSGYSTTTITITFVLVAIAAVAILVVVGAIFAVIFGHLTHRPMVRLAGLIVLAPIVLLVGWMTITNALAPKQQWFEKDQAPSRPPTGVPPAAPPATTPRSPTAIEYTKSKNCNIRRNAICRGTLARDQEVQGFPCRAQTEVVFSEANGSLELCTISRPFARQGVTWPAGTIIEPGANIYDSTYRLPADSEPIRIADFRIHSGLTIRMEAGGQLRKLQRNTAHPQPDTRLEVAGLVLELGESDAAYLINIDGSVVGGVLAQSGVLEGVPMKAGARVVVPPRRM